MTRRNDKRNNQPEFSPIGSMLLGALLGKGAEMIANKMKEKDENTPSIHTEGITDSQQTGNGKLR